MADVTPRMGQKWTHKQFGGRFEVVELNGGRVKLARVVEGEVEARLNMHVEQLRLHYYYLEG